MQGYNRNKQNFKPRSFSNGNDRYNKPKQSQPDGLAVSVRDGEDISRALRRLKKKVERAGILKELRDRQHYEKPSEKRRKAKKAGIARWKKKQRELELNR
jgi:small subunit ribosomal protein S21